MPRGGSATFHFPDGNASIVRLLVRSLVPGVLPGRGVEDIVTAKADYSRLDRPDSAVRIRLSSIVVKAKNLGPAGAANGAEVTYTRGGTLHAVRGKACVLACWNMMIPYLCPDLPDRQKEALHYLVKTPLVYTNVAIRNWHAFKALGISEVYSPGRLSFLVPLNPVVDIGAYKSVRSPDDPILVHMTRTALPAGA